MYKKPTLISSPLHPILDINLKRSRDTFGAPDIFHLSKYTIQLVRQFLKFQNQKSKSQKEILSISLTHEYMTDSRTKFRNIMQKDIFFYCITGNAQIINTHHWKYYCYIGGPGVAACEYPTQISIVKLSYERNCTSCKCTLGEDQQKTCKKFKPSDSWGNYYFYNTISGKVSSYASGQRMLCGSNIYSNIVHLNYSCVDSEYKQIQYGTCYADLTMHI